MKKLAAAVAALLVSGVGVSAGGLSGDGSYTNNPDLLREAVDGMDGACSNCDPGPPLIGFEDPLFDIDWSLALRGSYIQDSVRGNYWEAAAVPSFTLSHETSRTRLILEGSAEITRSSLEEARVSALRVAIAADYLVDEATLFNAGVDFSLSRAAVTSSGTASNVEVNPQVLEGSANASVVHRFGAVEVTLRGEAARIVYGPTTVSGGVLESNAHQSNTNAGGGLRVGFRMSPVLTVFGEVAANYARYDAASPTLLVPYDGTTYSAKAGLSAEWSSLLSAEASVGVGVRRYDAGLAEVRALLYDGRITFTPDETWEFNTTLSTALSPPGSSGGNGRVVHTLASDARYTVNPWLVLRASASATRTNVIGTGAVETSYALGVGSDYAVNEMVTVTADYTFDKADTPARTAHRWMLGLVFKK